MGLCNTTIYKGAYIVILQVVEAWWAEWVCVIPLSIRGLHRYPSGCRGEVGRVGLCNTTSYKGPASLSFRM